MPPRSPETTQEDGRHKGLSWKGRFATSSDWKMNETQQDHHQPQLVVVLGVVLVVLGVVLVVLEVVLVVLVVLQHGFRSFIPVCKACKDFRSLEV